MRVPIPPAPAWSYNGALWAAATGVAVFVLTISLAAIYQWLALIPNVLLALACIYLVGGELWNKRQERKDLESLRPRFQGDPEDIAPRGWDDPAA